MHLTQKGQVTIPKKIREKFGLSPKTQIGFREDHGKLMIVKMDFNTHPLESWVGVLNQPQSSDAMVNALRKPQ